MKSDARTRYTEKVIRDSFLSIMEEKPYSRITVKEICQKAEINRATFYNHYKDVYDLMDRLEERILASVDALVQEADFRDLPAYLTKLLSNMRQEGKTYLILISENGRPEILTKIGKRITERSYPLLKERLDGLSEEEKEACYFFILNGSAGVMRQWLSLGSRMSERELAEALTGVIHGAMAGSMQERRTGKCRRKAFKKGSVERRSVKK